MHVWGLLKVKVGGVRSLGRVNVKPKDFLEKKTTVVLFRGYLRRRELQGVGRLQRRGTGRWTPSLPPVMCLTLP